MHKSRSFLNYNIPKIERKEKRIINNEYKNDDDEYEKNENINYDNNKSLNTIKHNSKNGILLGFKNSVIKLTKDKMEVIKGLFPIEIKKRSLSPILNVKQIDNSNNEYIKYLENNISLSKTPSKMDKIYEDGINGMTGKKYISIESRNIINKIKYINKKRNQNTKSNDLLLPYINSDKRSSLNYNERINNVKNGFLNFKN